MERLSLLVSFPPSLLWQKKEMSMMHMLICVASVVFIPERNIYSPHSAEARLAYRFTTESDR